MLQCPKQARMGAAKLGCAACGLLGSSGSYFEIVNFLSMVFLMFFRQISTMHSCLFCALFDGRLLLPLSNTRIRQGGRAEKTWVVHGWDSNCSFPPWNLLWFLGCFWTCIRCCVLFASHQSNCKAHNGGVATFSHTPRAAGSKTRSDWSFSSQCRALCAHLLAVGRGFRPRLCDS